MPDDEPSVAPESQPNLAVGRRGSIHNRLDWRVEQWLELDLALEIL